MKTSWIVVILLLVTAATPRVSLSQEASAENVLHYIAAPGGVAHSTGRIVARTILSGGPGPATVDSLVTGLARISIGSDDPSSRGAAVFLLTDMAEAGLGNAQQTLLDLYGELEGAGIRDHILRHAHDFPDRDRTAAFLRRVVTDPEPVWEGHPEAAVVSLARMGPVGQQVLRDIHEGDTSGLTFHARYRIEELAKVQFRIRDGN